jgi:hypothetical protein
MARRYLDGALPDVNAFVRGHAASMRRSRGAKLLRQIGIVETAEREVAATWV